MSSYFFLESTKNVDNIQLINSLRDYSEVNATNIYVLDRPLTDQKYSYDYGKGLIVLSPKAKVLIVNYGGNSERFDEYVEDIIEDIGYISDKYNYKKILGRPRRWRNSLVQTCSYDSLSQDANELLEEVKLETAADLKHVNLLISLFVGSINDVERVKEEVPETLLDKVKQKILLFDGDQTRFIYGDLGKKRTVIQGLSGTGKTELLLHKLKDLYTLDDTSKIFFTCHNRILANNLKRRIPQFFNFMKVEQQIEWNSRLWCQHAWGSGRSPDSGAYRYICAIYDIPFQKFSYSMSFSKATKMAYEEIVDQNKIETIGHAFTYMFIDESQDFDENFFKLCEYVTEKRVFIAGDIFQNIFDENISSSIQPDYLLGKCYRTDPKTLMFAHGLGMGLFEEVKLRWLEEREWKDCGYNYQKDEEIITLRREPLRRFEDLEDSFESIRVQRMEDSYSSSVISIVREIFDENPTVRPDDIGIILLDGSRKIYELADALEFRIRSELKLKVNKAYESKTRIDGSIMISNRNNVKGLEFPFVICVTMKIVDNITYRNSLYTMLTRSFIKSYLLISNIRDSGLTDGMFKGLDYIIKHNEMKVTEPSEAEKSQIQTRFKYELKKESYWDIMMRLFDDLDVKDKYKNNLLKAAVELEMTDADEDQLREFIISNIKYLIGDENY